MMSMTPFPKTRTTNFTSLSPSVHWAQVHRRTPSFHWARTIYDFELLYVQHGEIEVHMHDQSYRVHSGSLIQIQPGVYHHVQVLTEPEAVFLGIHFDYFDELFVNRDEDIIVNESNVRPADFCFEPVYEENVSLKPLYILPPTSSVITGMKQIIDEFTWKKTGYQLTCKGLMLQIMGLLLRLANEPDSKPANKYTDQVLDIMQQMEAHCEQDWSTPQLAAMLNVSDDYAIKLFKGAVGQSPNKVVQSIRHQEAKRLLRETDWNMEVIARHVGYDDFHYFSRLFHKCEGMTARDYRKLSGVL